MQDNGDTTRIVRYNAIKSAITRIFKKDFSISHRNIYLSSLVACFVRRNANIVTQFYVLLYFVIRVK